MRTLTLCFLIAVFIPGSFANDSIRILCYNIKHGLGMDGELSLERTAGVIRQSSPDIVLLQEMDKNTGRSGGIDQPETLRHLSGMSYGQFDHAIEFDGGFYGLAILLSDRFEVIEADAHPVPATEGWEPRIVQSMVLVDTQPEDKPRFVLMNTHLDYHSDDRDRMAGVNIIQQRVDTYKPLPMLIGGDFNARPESRVIQTMRETWTLLTPLEPTAPADEPRSTIDYIFGLGLPADAVLEAEVIAEPVASDHRPVFVELRLGDESN